MKKTEWILPAVAVCFAVLIFAVSRCDSRPSELQTITPTRGTETIAPGSAVVSYTVSVDLNTAEAEELTRLPGIGPALAERIVAYREEHGPFETLEDLINVEGIGEGTLVNLYELMEQG